MKILLLLFLCTPLWAEGHMEYGEWAVVENEHQHYEVRKSTIEADDEVVMYMRYNDLAQDMAEALNEAHERRIAPPSIDQSGIPPTWSNINVPSESKGEPIKDEDCDYDSKGIKYHTMNCSWGSLCDEGEGIGCGDCAGTISDKDAKWMREGCKPLAPNCGGGPCPK